MYIDVEVEDSYSLATAERMSDAIDNFIKLLREIGSVDQYKNLFFGERIRLEERQRVLTDFADVELVEQGKQTFALVSLSNKAVLERVIEICAAANLEMKPIDATGMKLAAPLPTPTDNEFTIMKDNIDRLERTGVGTISRVKSDALQRIGAAVKREYVEALESKKIRDLLDVLHAANSEVVQVLAMRKRRDVLGDRYRPRTDREIAMYALIDDERYSKIPI